MFHTRWVGPTNNTLLINFRLSSDAEILLMSTDWAYKSVANVQKHVCKMYSILHTAVAGWGGTISIGSNLFQLGLCRHESIKLGWQPYKKNIGLWWIDPIIQRKTFFFSLWKEKQFSIFSTFSGVFCVHRGFFSENFQWGFFPSKLEVLRYSRSLI